MNLTLLAALFRHLLTAAGGYFVAQGRLDPADAETIGGALTALVGVVLSLLAKRRTPPTLPPGVARALLLAPALLLTLPGCASRPGAPELPPGQATEEFLAIARPLAEGFATAALARNPAHAPFVCGIADGMAVALQQAELTADMVDRFTAELRLRHPEVSAGDYALARSFLLGLHALWVQRFGPVLPGDAGAGRVLGELSALLRRACAAVP